jgi:hypothetical protein
VLHDSTLVAFAESQQKTTLSLDPLTLGDLLAVPQFKGWVTAMGFVAQDAMFADARRAMGSIQHCNDVFVTKTGAKDEPALGWVTNTLLAGIQ